MMRYSYDFEFEDNGKTIIPISLGMISDDDRELYLINKEYMQSYFDGEEYYWKDEPSIITEWLNENVLSKISQEDVHLFGESYMYWPRIVEDFISHDGLYTSRDEIELVGWYAAYDHVALAQMWGPMINLPDVVPMYSRELEDFRRQQKTPKRDKIKWPEHHALMDARYQRAIYRYWNQGT